MPKIELGEADIQEKKSIYPQRAFEYVDQAVDEIRKIISGEKPRIELSAAEKEVLLDFEKSLRMDFEKVYRITLNSTTLYLDYFATKEGRKVLWEKTGLELNSEDPMWIKDFLLTNSDHLARLSSSTRTALAGETLSHKDQFLLNEILKTADSEGNVSIQNIPVPQKIQILINPDKGKEKVEGLRKFKLSLKEKYEIIQHNEDESDDLKQAEKEILDIYRRRTNILIMDLFPYALLVEQKQKTVGEHKLSEDERKFLNFFEGLSSPEKNRSRLDKLIYGASIEYDKDGWKTQIPEALLPITERIAKIGEEAEMNKEDLIRARGLDPEKILGEKIDVETRADLGEEVLGSYSLLSGEPRTTFDSERKGKAGDGKWQVVNLPNRKTFGLNEQKGVVLGPQKKSYTVADTFEVLGHEIEGHVLQNENKKLIDLEYFQKFGKDSRAVILSEGGAMFVQNIISQEAFGYPTVPHPHYIRAMQKKLEGGNYLDCVKAFYDSYLKVLKNKRAEGKLTDQSFLEEVAKRLEEALNRSERLFGTGADFSSRKNFLTHSKDTAYLEQYILTEKLKEAGLEKLLFFGAGNLQDISTLLRYNLLDLDKIQVPKYQTLEIWKRDKHKYTLESG